MNSQPVATRIERYLQKRVREGTHFFKSRQIADDLDISVKRVGATITQLRERSSQVEIESWGGNSDGHTWYVDVPADSESNPGN